MFYLAAVGLDEINRACTSISSCLPPPHLSSSSQLFFLLIAYSSLSDCRWCSLETHSHCPDISISFLVILSKLYFPCLFCCVCCMCSIYLIFSLILLWFLSRCVKREVASCQFGIIDMIQLQRSYCNT